MLQADNKTCKASAKSLLVAGSSLIYRITLDTPAPKVFTINMHHIRNSIAIAYDATNGEF